MSSWWVAFWEGGHFVKIGSVQAAQRREFPLKRHPSLTPWLFAFWDVYIYNVYVHRYDGCTSEIVRRLDYEIVLVLSLFNR